MSMFNKGRALFAALLAFAGLGPRTEMPRIRTTQPKGQRRGRGRVSKARRKSTTVQRASRGSMCHRRQYLPLGRRRSCPFTYSRPDRDASAGARFRVIAHNDAMANAFNAARLKKSLEKGKAA